jgi:hypothetical protein
VIEPGEGNYICLGCGNFLPDFPLGGPLAFPPNSTWLHVLEQPLAGSREPMGAVTCRRGVHVTLALGCVSESPGDRCCAPPTPGTSNKTLLVEAWHLVPGESTMRSQEK